MDEEKSLAPSDVVARWGGAVCIGTLANWRSQGKGPAFKKFLGRVRYPVKQLEAFERKNGLDVEQETKKARKK